MSNDYLLDSTEPAAYTSDPSISIPRIAAKKESPRAVKMAYVPLVHRQRKLAFVSKKPDLVILSHFSPLCRLLLIISIILAIFFALFGVQLLVDQFYCGLNTDSHQIRIKNLSNIINSGQIVKGLFPNATYGEKKMKYSRYLKTVFTFNRTGSNETQVDYLYPFPFIDSATVAFPADLEAFFTATHQAFNQTKDESRKVNITEEEFGYLFPPKYNPWDDNATLVNATGAQNVSVNGLAFQLVVNYTVADGYHMEGLVFGDNTQSVSQLRDGGAAFDVIISNPKRARVQVQEPWFNLLANGNPFYRFTYLDPDLNSDKYSMNNMCKLVHKYMNGTKYGTWVTANATNPGSLMPLWFFNLDNLVNRKETACNSNFNLTILTNPYACVSPLLVRQIPFTTVNFTSVTTNSDYILDFWDEYEPKKNENNQTYNDNITLTFNDSQFNRIWLLNNVKSRQRCIYQGIDFQDEHYNCSVPINVILDNSTVGMYIPYFCGNSSIYDCENTSSFYGIAGNDDLNNISNTEWNSSTHWMLYQMKYAVRQRLHSGLRLSFQNAISIKVNQVSGSQFQIFALTQMVNKNATMSIITIDAPDLAIYSNQNYNQFNVAVDKDVDCLIDTGLCIPKYTPNTVVIITW